MVGTEDGVSKFDGTSFINYSERDGLPDKDIMELFCDRRGRIWFIGYNGKMSCYYRGVFYPGGHIYPALDSIRIGLVSGVTVDNKGRHWIWGEKLIEMDGEQVRVWPVYLPAGEEKIRQFEQADDSSYLMFFGSEISRFSSGRQELLARRESGVAGHKMKGAFSRGKDSFLYYTRSELFIFGREGEELRCLGEIRYPFRIHYIVKENGKGGGIITEDDGLYLYDDLTKPGTFEHYLKGRPAGKYLKDKEDAIWMLAAEQGVYYLPAPQIGVTHQKQQYLSDKVCSVTAGLAGDTWFALDNGTVIRKSRNGAERAFRLHGNRKLYDRVRTIVCISKDEVWAGGDRGLYQIKASENRITKHPTMGSVKAVALTGEGELLVAAYNGAYRLNPRTRKTDTLFRMRSTAIQEHGKGRYLIGGTEGLYLYDAQKTIVFEGPDGHKIRTHVTCIKSFADGMIWIGTSNTGMLIIRGSSVVRLDEQDGLAGNSCKQFFTENSLTTWVATNKGVSRISVDRTSYCIRNYDVTSGLLEPNVNQLSIVNDTAWLGTDYGLVYFDKDWEPEIKHIPPVYITSVTNGSQQPLRNGTRLAYNDNSLRIMFAGISFRSRGDIAYNYRLQGMDTSWTFTDLNSVEYPALPPGDYVFEVYARSSAGVWSSSPASFRFSISYPFWQTTAFRVLLIACAGILAGLGVYLFQRRRYRKISLRQKILDLELSALKAQMNPHFIFNCLNSIQYFIAENNKKAAQYYLGSFARLIRRTLEYADRSSITLSEEIIFLENYLSLEQMKQLEPFDFRISVSDGMDTSKLLLPPLLIQIYAENAIRHGLPEKKRHGMLLITFRTENDFLVCTIEDNGIGRKRAAVYEKPGHQSSGMHMNRKRIEALNALGRQKIRLDIKDKGNEASGTIVILYIPIHYDSKEQIISYNSGR